jgi:glutamyl-tRNA synthetase
MGPETQDDIILIKSDGLPTYNFAHIVDDSSMGITHIMRGQEYLPSMGNYLALYEALGVPRPVFVHLPHILGPSGNKKLSKRDGAKSVTDYRNDGILPEAMLNYLACLGWNDGTEDEMYTKEELIEKFKLDRIQRAGARFDETKLLWLNGQWIRRRFAEDPKKLFAETANFWPESAKNVSDEEKYKIFCIIYDRLKTLSDLRTMTTYFFEDPTIDMSMIQTNKALKKLSESELCQILSDAANGLSELNEWSAEMLQNKLNELMAKSEQKPAVFFGLIRLSVSFAPFSPALHDTLSVLGKEKALARMHAVVTAFKNDQQ